MVHQVGEWMLEQDVLAPSPSRDSKGGLALLLQAECFVSATHSGRLLCLGKPTNMVLLQGSPVQRIQALVW